MPIYEYCCGKCGNRFEELVFQACEVTPCPSCGNPETERLPSAFAVGGGSSRAEEGGPCGVCGAPQRGMCGE